MALVFIWEASLEKGFKWMWVIWEAVPGSTREGGLQKESIQVKEHISTATTCLRLPGTSGPLATQSVGHGPAASEALGAGEKGTMADPNPDTPKQNLHLNQIPTETTFMFEIWVG